ncbi:MAG: glutathione peroxidase [Thiobacillus sp.]|nr:glutathione peroxidase [Thiobacillus sp.]
MNPVLLVGMLLLSAGVNAASACAPLLNFNLTDIDGKDRDLCTYAGKVVLVVNTASQCGYTGQYKGLQALSDQYGPQGLVVLGLPANDFGGQEPGSNATIKNFCEVGYKVDFPLFAKTGVTAANANPLHEALAKATGERPRWNFHKYLIDRSGTRALSFASHVDPQSKQMMQAIESLLKARTRQPTLTQAEK